MGFEVTVSNSRVHIPDLHFTVISFSVYLGFLPCAECLVVFFKIQLHTTAPIPYSSGLFFSKLNSEHITSKQDKGDKSVISIELVKNWRGQINLSSSDGQKIFGAHLMLFLLFTNQYNSYSHHHLACQNT